MRGSKKSYVLGGIVLAVQSLAIAPSAAEIISVTTTDDHNDGACDLDCTFREALAKASGNFEPDEIILAAGPTFTLTMGTLVVTTGNTTIKGLGCDG